MTEWMSQTDEIAIVSLENSGTGGAEIIDGQAQFKADLYVGMRSKAEIAKYFDAIASYLPAANTIRMPINAKSLQKDVPGSAFVTLALQEAAKRGYRLILVYTDPIFHGDHRKPFDTEYYENNINVVNGMPILLDGENPKDILRWGSQSPEQDPVDALASGWGAVHDWLDAHPQVKARVYGYELVNEPGRIYRNAKDVAQMQAYANAMTELYQANAGRWTSDLQGDGSYEGAHILVDIAGSGSGRVGALDAQPPKAGASGLDLIRRTIGKDLIWSIHTFTDMSVAEFAAPDSYTKIAALAGDNILVTETQFDGDFQLLDGKNPAGRDLAAFYGLEAAKAPADTAPLQLEDLYDTAGQYRLASWMGWELLDPIMGSRNYFGARDKEWFAAAGIGSAYWTPVGFDASMLVGYSGRQIEMHRDITAFANLMWAEATRQPSPALQMLGQMQGTDCPAETTLCISDIAPMINGSAQASAMLGFGFDQDDRIMGVDSPQTEGGLRDLRQGGRQITAGQMQYDANFRANGDMAYGGSGNDRLDLRGGDDYGFGGAGDDVIDAGSGQDVVLGGTGDDQLFGGAGDDVLEGGEGADQLDGGAGRDLLIGGPGNDLLSGGPGADYFYVDAAGDGTDRITDFEWGVDRLVIGDHTTFFDQGKRQVTLVDTTQPLTEFRYGEGAKILFGPKPVNP